MVAHVRITFAGAARGIIAMSSNPPATPGTAVAVVLVTYQSERDLAMCLGSLERAAGPHPLEVVVVDNASTDASVEIARGYGAKVLENRQPGACRGPSTWGWRSPGRPGC